MPEPHMDDALLARFRTGLERARAAALPEPTAMLLATVDEDGCPSARVVLLKEVDERGFVFYTNLASVKARHIQANPRVALTFWWRELEEQVRIEGDALRVTDAQADAYFASRPRASQLGAWASRQSHTLVDRAELEACLRGMEQRFAGGPVPRPPFWSGFRVVPRRIEFWYGRPHRLHERICFAWRDEGWTQHRLFP